MHTRAAVRSTAPTRGGTDDCDPSDCIALYGYGPPEHPVCYDGSCYTDGALSAGSTNPCDSQSAIFNPSAAVIGCMQHYAPIIPIAAPPTPTCSIALYERPVIVSGVQVAEHTYFDAIAALGSNLWVNFLCQGGPSTSSG